MPPSGVSPRGQVLLITDDRENAALLSRWISEAGERPVLLSGRERSLMEAGDDETFDLVVTDLDTEDPGSHRTLERLLSGQLFRGVPQIHLLRELGRMDALPGDDDRVVVQGLPYPPHSVDFQARVRLASEIGRLRRELARSSIRDPMTGLTNRCYLRRRLDEEFSRARRYRTPLSLAYVDVDRLRDVNERFGESAGDAVIRATADLIRRQIRCEDVLARVGDNCFGIVLPGNRCRGAATLANKIRTEAEETRFAFHGGACVVRVSAGLSTFPDNSLLASADEIIRAVETALAEAKSRGGNRVFIDEEVLRPQRRLVLVADGDPALLDLAEDLLAMDDMRVVRASDAAIAVEILRFRRPDLVVLDLSMRDDPSGRMLAELVHELHPDARIPVIGLSRDAEAGPDAIARAAVDRFLTTPFSPTLLRSLARELLEV